MDSRSHYNGEWEGVEDVLEAAHALVVELDFQVGMRIPIFGSITVELILPLILIRRRLNVVAVVCANDLHMVHSDRPFGPGQTVSHVWFVVIFCQGKIGHCFPFLSTY